MTTNEAVAIFGSKAEIARALGISRASVTEWGEKIPELRVYQLREILVERQTQNRTAVERAS